jgi:endogenous inhibitor of DNA gyrase (YacG/DUF329 family)
MIIKTCLICNKQFIAKKKKQLLCSNRCKNINTGNIHRGMKKKKKGNIYVEKDECYLIKTNKGDIIIDKNSYSTVKEYTWHIHESSSNIFYARTRGINKKTIRLHKLLMFGFKETKLHVDHINRNTLDNRLCNLRICVHKQNVANRGGLKNKTSKYKGVHINSKTNKWVSQCSGKHIGCYISEEEAAIAYNKKAYELFGDFAYLNNISISK